MFVKSLPSACAARSVHCMDGFVNTKLVPRTLKFDPGRDVILKFPPLNPPRDGSNGDVVSDVDTAASRGRLFVLDCRPFSVVLFWSEPRPRTENASGSPSSPGTSRTPGNDAAIAAILPCRSGGRVFCGIERSVPLTSGVFWNLLGRC